MGFRDRLRRMFGSEQRATEWGTSAIPGPSVGPSETFARVDLRHAEGALQSVAVWASADLIASLASTLPLGTFRRASPNDPPQRVPSPRIVVDPGGEGYGRADWLYQYMLSMLLRGNVYGRPALNGTSPFPALVVLLHPDDVTGWRDRQTGTARWIVDHEEVPAGTIWHQRAYPMPGRLLGMSPVAHHALTIGQGIQAARFGAQWFADGAHPSSILQNSESEVDQKAAAKVKARYLAAVHGTREPLVLGRGWQHKALSVSAEESQFLLTQQYTAAECARIFGPGVPEILGYQTGGNLTYSNVEQRSSDLLKYTMDRWLRHIEDVFTAMLPRPQYVKYDRQALLATDLLTRYKAYAIGIASHIVAPSEARDEEERPPLTDEQLAELDKIAPVGPVLTNPLKESVK